jgi:hypothetical protein
MGFNEQAQSICCTAYHVGEQLARTTVDTVSQIEPLDGTHALFAAITTAGGPLKTLAEILAPGERGDDQNGKGNKELMLVAALVTARVMIPNETGIKIDFSSRNVMAAIEVASKVAGYDIKPFVNRCLLDHYQGYLRQHEDLTMGYWDYLDNVGPDFDDFSEDISNFTRH